MTKTNDNSSYQLRGARVAPLSASDVVISAYVFSSFTGLSESTGNNACIYGVIEKFCHLDIVPDKQWYGLTNGHYDPTTETITLPENTLKKAAKKDKRNIDSLRIVLHEIGHAFLGHKALLHHADTPPVMEEDAEWQADYFAEQVLLQMGLLAQQSFPFYQQ